MITKLFNAMIIYKKYNKKLATILENIKKKNLQAAELIINNDFPKNLYTKSKIKNFQKTNIKSLIFKFSNNIHLCTINKIITIINNDKNINAISIQLPVPKKINTNILLNKIKINKDVDMLNKQNFANYITTNKKNKSSTALAIIETLKIINIKINNLKIILLGFSNIIGKPILFSLFERNATIILINKKYKNIKLILKNADIIIIALGKKNYLKSQDIPHGCIIIDVGINTIENKIIIGDFKIPKKLNNISYLTPVPGGIGLITLNKITNNIIKTKSQ